MVQFIFEGSRTNLSFWSKFAYVLVRTGVTTRMVLRLKQHDTVVAGRAISRKHKWNRRTRLRHRGLRWTRDWLRRREYALEGANSTLCGARMLLLQHENRRTFPSQPVKRETTGIASVCKYCEYVKRRKPISKHTRMKLNINDKINFSRNHVKNHMENINYTRKKLRWWRRQRWIPLEYSGTTSFSYYQEWKMINRSKLVNGKDRLWKSRSPSRSGIGEELNEDLQIHLFINHEANGG